MEWEVFCYVVADCSPRLTAEWVYHGLSAEFIVENYEDKDYNKQNLEKYNTKNTYNPLSY